VGVRCFIRSAENNSASNPHRLISAYGSVSAAPCDTYRIGVDKKTNRIARITAVVEFAFGALSQVDLGLISASDRFILQTQSSFIYRPSLRTLGPNENAAPCILLRHVRNRLNQRCCASVCLLHEPNDLQVAFKFPGMGIRSAQRGKWWDRQPVED
jgi:hypothetical protein